MAGTAHLPRSGQGDPAEYVNLENARLQNTSINDSTATELGDTSRRTSIFIQNQSVADFSIGFDNTVTASGATRGVLITAGSQMSFNFAEPIPIFAISASGTHDVTVVESY